ncbi:DUF1887 family protein [bacterium]|nr:DUF1887 family protein [bacterium]
MNKIMIVLVGEQPAPNLLPLRFMQPEKMLLVKTSHPATQQIIKRLKSFFVENIEPFELEVDAFQIAKIRRELELHVRKLGWQSSKPVFNITGGTKPMSIAAFQAATTLCCPAIYFQSQGNRSLLYRFEVGEDGEMHEAGQTEIPDAMTLHDYLRLYLGDYGVEGPRDNFEKLIYEFLLSTSKLSEVISSVRPQATPNLEMDLVFRLANQVGVAEVKESAGKKAIDQVNSAAEQRHLGTYIKKFIISGKPMDQNNRVLAAEYGIHVIELEEYNKSDILPRDREQLLGKIVQRMGGRP